MNTTENLFNYSDYRTFLRDYVEHKKKKDPTWSYAVWARRLKLKSPSTLVMIVNGQRNPGDSLSKELTTYFKLNEKQQAYFEGLVRLEKVKADTRLAVLVMEDLSKAHPKGHFTHLNAQQFSVISHWYFYAIREMVNLKHFVEDPKWISRQLGNEVNPKKITDAISTLLELKLLKRLPSGKLAQDQGRIDTSYDVADEGLKRFHSQMLEKAHHSIRSTPLDDRENVGTTFGIKKEKLPEAKKLIRKFKKDFCHLLEQTNSDAIYQLEIAFFPLTKKMESYENIH